MRNNDNAIKIVDGNVNGSNWQSSIDDDQRYSHFTFSGRPEKKSWQIGKYPRYWEIQNAGVYNMYKNHFFQTCIAI